jgi:hypothetical protein
LAITDTPSTIKALINEIKLGKALVLGRFNPSDKDSLSLLYQLYAGFHIRTATLTDFLEFDHFLWHYEQPEDFFEIQQQENVIFQIWGKNVEKLTVNMLYSLKESFAVSTPEVKVITPTLLPYFVLPDHPLHPAYKFLSAAHKADYLRCYLMHFYGGGYSDIKHLHFDFQPYF